MKGFFGLPWLVYLATAFSVFASSPTIDSSQPADVTANLASAADFSVLATNAASYQWQTNGINVPGATNATFALDNVTDNNVDVVITSPDGESITSRAAKLTTIQGTVVNLTITGYADASSNTFTIQLFDQDKPATVANFLHYITSGVFTNMFFDRLVTNFVLQGGSYDVASPTNDDTPVENGSEEIFSINDSYVGSPAISPILPLWVDSEYLVGPVIHNRFGTVAMALKSGDPDSATGAFFFNLADNSTNLDNQDGGFTVFGRVTSGSNALSYFNTFSKPDHGIFDESTVDVTPVFTDLPVNFTNFDIPVNTNLFYAHFNFPAGFPVDTNYPVGSKTNLVVDTNTSDVKLYGTTSDNVGLARVFGSLTSTNPVLGAGPFKSISTSNWFVDCGVLPASANYDFTLTVQDGAGNQTNFFYQFSVPVFPLRVVTNGRGTFTPLNAANTNMDYLSAVTLKAKASPGSTFIGWTIGTNQGTLNTSFTVINTNGGTVVANFVSNNLPGGIHFTYPTAGAKLTNPVIILRGAGAKTAPQPSEVITRIYNRTSKTLLFTGSTTNFTNNAWAVPLPELVPGLYTAQAVAITPSGKGAVADQNFDVLGAVEIVVNGPGKTSLKTGTNFVEINQIHSVQAIPFAGASFHDWTGLELERLGMTSTYLLSSAESIESPLVLEATFFSNDVPKTAFTITLPKPGAIVYDSAATTSAFGAITGSITVTGTVSDLTRVTCQAFTNNINLEPSSDVVEATINGATWSAVLPRVSAGPQKIIAVGYDSAGRTRLLEESITLSLFPAVSGIYNGLFLSADVGTLDSGKFTLTVYSNGAAGGSILIPGITYQNREYPYPINIRFPGVGTLEFSPGYFRSEPIVCLLDLFSQPLQSEVGVESEVLEGEIAQADWEADIFSYKQAVSLTPTSTPATGNYVVLFTPTTTSTNISIPTASSYAFLTISSNGTFQLAGTLADDSTFSEGSTCSTNGFLPFFSIPSGYKNFGMLIGWESFVTNILRPESINWTKGKVGNAYYPSGFAASQTLETTGGIFEAPTNGQYTIVFSGGALTNSLTNTLTCVSGQFQTSSNVTAISLTTNGAMAGFVSGEFVDPSGVSNAFQGAFISPSQGGGGFVLQSNQTTAKFVIASP